MELLNVFNSKFCLDFVNSNFNINDLCQKEESENT